MEGSESEPGRRRLFAGGGLRAILEKVLTGGPSAARPAIERILENKPDFALGHLVVGNGYLRERRLEECVAAYGHALDINPTLAPPPFLEGIDQGVGGATSERNVLEGAIELDERVRARGNRAEVGLDTEDLAAVQDLVTTDPQSESARLLLANLLFRSGSASDAIEVIEGVIADNPELLVARQMLGFIWLDVGESEKAKEAFRELVDIAPDRLMGHFHLGNAHFALEEYADAEREFQTVADRFQNLKVVQYRMADALIKQGRYTEAIPVLRNVLRRAKKVNCAHQRLGLCYTRIARYDMAIEEFNSAFRCDPRLPRHFPQLEELLRENANPEGVATEIAQALLAASAEPLQSAPGADRHPRADAVAPCQPEPVDPCPEKDPDGVAGAQAGEPEDPAMCAEERSPQDVADADSSRSAEPAVAHQPDGNLSTETAAPPPAGDEPSSAKGVREMPRGKSPRPANGQQTHLVSDRPDVDSEVTTS